MEPGFFPMVRTAESPLLARLRSALELDRASALADFWDEVARRTTPILEPIDGASDQVLVTFVWREDEAIENVALIENFSVVDPRGTPLDRIADTNVYARSFIMCSDLRFTYQYSVNDSLISIYEDRDAGERSARFQPDPLNPRTAAVTFLAELGVESADWTYSYVELPDAAPAPHMRYRPDIAHGTIARTTFTSTVLGNERDIFIHTPAGIESAGPCPLLLLFDGESAVEWHVVPNTLDNLIADGLIPPTICVMVTSNDRSIEYPCNERFADFIGDELVPWARRTYSIADGAEHVTACGVSYGGLVSAWLGLRRPKTVGNVISHSGSFQWRWNTGRIGRDTTNVIGAAPEYGWLPAQVSRWDPVPTRFWIEAGRLEALNAGVEPSLLACTRHMRDVLIAKGHDVRYQEYGGGHDFVNWRGSVADALIHFVRWPTLG